MPDSFDLLEEVPQSNTSYKRERYTPKTNRAKPKRGVVEVFHWGRDITSPAQVLDPERGSWELVYAVYHGADVPVAVAPELAQLIDREEIKLNASYSRESGLMYIRGRFPVPGKKHRVRQSLQRFVCGLPLGKLPVELHVNHQTRYTLDNRPGNLEVVIPAVNLHDRRHVGTGVSKYCGVSQYRGRILEVKRGKKIYAETSKPYRVIGWFGGKRKNVGLFENEEDAGRAYDRFILQCFKRSVVMMRLVGTILPLEQINKLLNFKRSNEELEAYFRTAILRAKAKAPRRQEALRELQRIVTKRSPKEIDDPPF